MGKWRDFLLKSWLQFRGNFGSKVQTFEITSRIMEVLEMEGKSFTSYIRNPYQSPTDFVSHKSSSPANLFLFYLLHLLLIKFTSAFPLHVFLFPFTLYVPMESSSVHLSKRNLTNQQRSAIFQNLLAKSSHGKFKKGSIREVASLFSAHVKTISRIWRQGKAAVINGGLIGRSIDVSSKKAARVGHKRVRIEPNTVTEVPFSRRTHICSLSNELKVTKSTVHRRIKEGMMRPH